MKKNLWVVLGIVVLSALLAGCARFLAPENPSSILEPAAPSPNVPEQAASYAPDQIPREI